MGEKMKKEAVLMYICIYTMTALHILCLNNYFSVLPITLFHELEGWQVEAVWVAVVHPCIFMHFILFFLSSGSQGSTGASLSCHKLKAGWHPGQVTSLSQGNLKKSHSPSKPLCGSGLQSAWSYSICTHSSPVLSSPPPSPGTGWWEEPLFDPT